MDLHCIFSYLKRQADEDKQEVRECQAGQEHVDGRVLDVGVTNHRHLETFLKHFKNIFLIKILTDSKFVVN